MIDILFLTYADPNIPSRRFRVEAFLPFIKKAGWTFKVVELSDGALSRLLTLALLPRARIIVLHKKLLRLSEVRAIRARGGRLIYDFDDAVFLSKKGGRRFGTQLAQCDLVWAGNTTLAQHASPFCARVEIIPTAVDVAHYLPRDPMLPLTPVIGWMGTHYNLENLEILAPALAAVQKKKPFALRYVCDYENPTLSVEGWTYQPWSAVDEISQVSQFNIGVMPLLDTEYNRGKCGFKILQYMAAGVPPIASPVGVNREIITHGINGFLAENTEQWEQAFNCLLSDSRLYAEISRNARARAEDFSCERVFERLKPGLV